MRYTPPPLLTLLLAATVPAAPASQPAGEGAPAVRETVKVDQEIAALDAGTPVALEVRKLDEEIGRIHEQGSRRQAELYERMRALQETPEYKAYHERREA